MNGYYLLLDYIKQLLESDINCNTVTTDEDLSETDLAKKDIYPLAHIVADTGSFNEGVIQFNIELFCLDQVGQNNELKNGQKFIGNDNEQDVLNTTVFVLKRVYNKLMISEGVRILDSAASIQKVDRKENNLIGWSSSFTVEVADNVMRFC